MARLHVEGWAPDYGSPVESDEGLAPDADKVDDTAEVVGEWAPLVGEDDGVDHVAFVDGVRRIDARLTIDDPLGPIPGICGSIGVGAVHWDRRAHRSMVDHATVDRLAVFAAGRSRPVPVADPHLGYRSEAVPDPDPAALIRHFHGTMRSLEADLAERLAAAGTFVVADGPINDLSRTPKVGYIKSHRAPYLPPHRVGIVGRLGAGERTPLFTIGHQSSQFPRYSWYLRLATVRRGHTWSGVVRCEVSTKLGLDEAVRLANRTTALLPLVASEGHIDPRAPQNLVPIAALERELRRRLGDPTLIHRKLRSAVMAGIPA